MAMKKMIQLFVFLLFHTVFSQSGKAFPVITISKSYKLGFRTYNKEFKMYQDPFILNGGKKYKIEGYSSTNYSEGGALGISPNKQYIVLDHISKGYVEDGKSKRLYENYLCVIVDISKKKVVTYMQSDCDGEWNSSNQWLSSDGRVVFP